jgi:hypothetical protein
MRDFFSLTVAALVLVGSSKSQTADRPQLLPTRDVSIFYEVSQPNRKRVDERVRWLVHEGLERIDGPNYSIIIDRKANATLLLNSNSHMYSVVNGAPSGTIEPESGNTFKRGAESVVAGIAMYRLVLDR